MSKKSPSLKVPTKPELVWRTSRQIKGVRAQLVGELNANTDGAHVTIDIKTARNLVEICDQAVHTEDGHEQ